MRERPTVVLVHGGPGSYDHSYFKPYFAHLTSLAQVVSLDLRDHGRSTRHHPEEWSFEVRLEHQSPGMPGMARTVEHRDEAPDEVAEYHRRDDPGHIAERADII
jgi:pimeloyl-ACP methyl ester carboxylesterase